MKKGQFVVEKKKVTKTTRKKSKVALDLSLGCGTGITIAAPQGLGKKGT